MNTKYIKFIWGAAMLLSGILSVRVQAQTLPRPGGVTSNYTWAAWLTPDSYNSGTWTNLITTPGTVGNFTAPDVAPFKTNGGYNFHPAVQFTSTTATNAPNRLTSSGDYVIQSGDNMTVILVMQRGSRRDTYDYLLSFNNGGVLNRQLWFNASNRLRLEWPTTADRDFTFEKGIFALDNSNNNTNDGIAGYVNGLKSTQASGAAGTNNDVANKKLIIGSGQTGSYYGFDGTIQELIVLKANGSNNHIDATDLRKIHSYLAIKYGITLNSSDNYVNSDNTVVWNRSADGAQYNNNIFGIARDDFSALYQKQSSSSSDGLITAYLGNTLPSLNSQNTAVIANDKTHLLFGSNGGPSVQSLTGLSANEVYENGAINMSEAPNIQSPVYRTQLTGETSMTLNLKTGMSDYAYVLVSNNAAFPTGATGGTRCYPIVDYIAQNVVIGQSYRFVKLIGFAPGPGGVTPGLRLWLKADEPASLTIDERPASDAGTSGNNLTAYSLPAGYTGTIPAVSEWKDLVRGHTYSYAAGGSATAHRIPVMKRNSPEMNYYPAVQFWANGNSYASYLSNPNGIMPNPANGEHTAYFLVNNNFGTNNWIYAMGFGQTSMGAAIPRPGYGAYKVPTNSGPTNSRGNIVGRFRTSGQATGGYYNLFSEGATSMLGYLTINGNNKAVFRFNAQEDHAFYSGDYMEATGGTFSWGNINMTTGSTLGSAYDENRTIIGVMSEALIYDRKLTPTETRAVESYMALKYGITLYPKNMANDFNSGNNPGNTYDRFNYTFSDNTIIWEGDTPSGNKFADFYNNISAVIRDDAARLHNKHSHSTNVGSILHLGVAGTRLSADGSEVGRLDNDLEAVISGNDGALGNSHILDPADCGDFTDRFNRKWLIHKVTQGDRPIAMLVGAQNNAGLTIGNDTNVSDDYYTKLGSGHDVSLIVGKTPADIDAGNYTAVVPMSYINGEHQCNYTFTDEDTYITFGWKVNNKGCVGDEDAVFTGTKKFEWTQWTTSTNTSTAAGLSIPTSPFSPVDLDDNIQVTSTRVVFPPNVRANRGYPRSANTPAKGSLHVQRRGGGIDQDVIITIQFNHPVVPEFSISDLDSYLNSYEEVEILGRCAGNTYLPVLSYVASQSASTYKINGSRATVTKRGIVSPTNKNGMLNVAFRGGVTEITIRFRTKTRTTSVTRNLYISPITLRAVPPPPPINEDGLSFVKQVKERQITTCEPVEYSFYIQNTNCDDKPVNFSDILPEKMTWEAGSFGLDAVSSDLNLPFAPQINPATSGNGEELVIENLLVPGSSTLILTATAILDEDAPSAQYDNRASITYEKIVESIPVSVPPFYSVDRETLEPYTSFNATYAQRQDQVVMVPTYSRTSYSANSEIEVTYTLTNTNADITGMFLNVNFNEEFTLMPNTVTVTQISGSDNPPVPVQIPIGQDDSPNTLSIAGATDGSVGFVLPTGVMEIKFKLKAPALSNVQKELNDNNQQTGRIVDLDITYDFSSDMDDPCMQTAIRGLHGNKLIPYLLITHIITNKNVSGTILK
jgi:hypothetical protein